jgi:hypothetical protein
MLPDPPGVAIHVGTGDAPKEGALFLITGQV